MHDLEVAAERGAMQLTGSQLQIGQVRAMPPEQEIRAGFEPRSVVGIRRDAVIRLDGGGKLGSPALSFLLAQVPPGRIEAIKQELNKCGVFHGFPSWAPG